MHAAATVSMAEIFCCPCCNRNHLLSKLLPLWQRCGWACHGLPWSLIEVFEIPVVAVETTWGSFVHPQLVYVFGCIICNMTPKCSARLTVQINTSIPYIQVYKDYHRLNNSVPVFQIFSHISLPPKTYRPWNSQWKANFHPLWQGLQVGEVTEVLHGPADDVNKGDMVEAVEAVDMVRSTWRESTNWLSRSIGYSPKDRIQNLE